ncbi:MAG TPA: hypothetical protein V6D15_09290 [Oculatellaceae cyanobacterium]|jgi:hypothetical protein
MVEEKLYLKFNHANLSAEILMKYWRLISIDAKGKPKSQEIPSAKAFFTSLFLDNQQTSNDRDAHIQRQLCKYFRGESPNNLNSTSNLAELCLRCFISSQIESTCIQLEHKFGINHGFNRYDLFPFVLNDVILNRQPNPNSYTTLASEILQTFNPDKSNLSTWTNRLVLHHRELNGFLLEHGVYLISDWAILNDTTPKQLQRIFSEFYQSTVHEAQQAVNLLSNYHKVYRRQRLIERQAGIKGKCSPPTDEQLDQIGQPLNLAPQNTIKQLQNLALKLRQYRILVRRKTLPTLSLDDPDVALVVDSQVDPNLNNTLDDDQLQSEFLQLYRQQFINSLDSALQQVTLERINNLQRRNSASVSQFTTALHLFHCQGESMGNIAPLINLQAQYQVTRLLKLKEFRADVRQRMLKLLLDNILPQAITYAAPERLSTLSQQVESALDEKITEMIISASSESSTAKYPCAQSLFSQRLCLYLAQLTTK